MAISRKSRGTESLIPRTLAAWITLNTSLMQDWKLDKTYSILALTFRCSMTKECVQGVTGPVVRLLQAVTLPMTCTQKMPGLNFGQDTGYLHCSSLGISPGSCQESTSCQAVTASSTSFPTDY
jgi:hypothetical protein